MTTLRRMFDAFQIAVAAFWLYARPPPHELEIIEEIPAETSPQAIPGDDALAQPAPPSGDPIDWQEVLTEQPDPCPVFYLMSFSQDVAGELTFLESRELSDDDLLWLQRMDPDDFAELPDHVQGSLMMDIKAGTSLSEALKATMAASMLIN